MDSWQEKYLKYKYKYLELSGSGKKMKKQTKNTYKLNRSETDMEISPKYIENLSEPWFTLISLGLKTVEGRKNKGRFKEMQVGDIVRWENKDFNPRSVLTRIIKKAEYKTFQEYLEKETLSKCLPGITSMDDGLSVYFKYFTKEDEATYGVIAIEIELI